MPLTSFPDLATFRVIPPRDDVRVEDLALPDGTSLVGPDGLLIPAARQYASIVNSATRIYSYRYDEAMRDDRQGALSMRRDAFLRGLFEERILPTINREWQLEVDDAERPEQRRVRDGLTSIIKNIPDFDAYKRANLDGVWFGKSGCQWAYQRKRELQYKWGISRWDPLHGDSIQFTFDGVPAIMMDSLTTSWYASHGAKYGPLGQGDLVPTDRGGTALVLHRPYWRDRFSIHVHMREKADYFEGELAGSVQGLGLRGLVYWHYMIRTDVLTWMLAYMQAVGQMDLMVFNYPWNNAEAKLVQEANAQKIIGKAAIVCPRNPQGNWAPIEQVQMNAAGVEVLHKINSDYFDRHIERLFVGQSMSSGADKGTGLGGTGRALFCKDTKDEILIYDTGRLDSTFTNDLVGPLLKYNYPWADFPVRFKSVMPDVKAKEKVESGGKMIQSGVPIKVDEYREAGGFSRPKVGDEVIAMPVPGAPPMIVIMGPNGPEPPAQMGGPPKGAILPPGTPGGAVPDPRTSMYPQVPGSPPGIQPALAPAPPAYAGGALAGAGLGPHGSPNGFYNGPQAQSGAILNDSGGGGVPPTSGPVMGAPQGGNTYIPGWGRRRNPNKPVGFTRFPKPGGLQ
jgi:hypothetical protein